MSIISKVVGGLSKQYYIRQFLFGCIFAVLFIYLAVHTYSSNINSSTLQLVISILFAIVYTLLYPYSRFVYESVVGYIMGDNVFFLNIFILMIFKFITMLLCWTFSIFIAPVGMLYLYYYHTKKEREL